MGSVFDNNSIFSDSEITSLEPGCKLQSSLKCKDTKHTFPASQRTWPEVYALRKTGCCLEDDTFMCCSSTPQWGSGFALSLAVIGSSWQHKHCVAMLVEAAKGFIRALIPYSLCCTAKLHSGVLRWSSAAVNYSRCPQVVPKAVPEQNKQGLNVCLSKTHQTHCCTSSLERRKNKTRMKHTCLHSWSEQG